MIGFGAQTQVYLAAGATDMRKQIDGLAALVVDVLQADPFSSHLFVFCNRGRDKLKILYWHNVSVRATTGLTPFVSGHPFSNCAAAVPRTPQGTWRRAGARRDG
jgi:transposase